MSNNRRLGLGIGVILLLVLILGNWISRQISLFSSDDVVHYTETDYQQSNDVDRSLAVFAQSIDLGGDVDGYALLAADSAVILDSFIEQDLIVVATDIDFSGGVQGDMVLLAENIRLDGTVEGEVVVVAETLDVAESYAGSITACVEQPLPAPRDALEFLPCDRSVPGQLFSKAGTRLASVGFTSLLENTPGSRLFGIILPLPLMLSLTALGALIVTIFPHLTSNIEATVRVRPQQMLLTGGMVILMFIGVTVVYMLLLVYATFAALILLPLYLFVIFVIAVLDVIGWVTLMLAFGRWTLSRFSTSMSPPLIAVVTGGGILTLAGYGISWLPGGDVAALLLFVIMGLAGLGAAFATRLGRRVLLMRT